MICTSTLPRSRGALFLGLEFSAWSREPITSVRSRGSFPLVITASTSLANTRPHDQFSGSRLLLRQHLDTSVSTHLTLPLRATECDGHKKITSDVTGAEFDKT
jgi:hypothetical protein